MTQGYRFDEHGVRRIVQTVRRVEQGPRTGGVHFPPMVSSGSSQWWRPGYNASGETIPAYSVARIEAGSVIDGVYHHHLEKPSTPLGEYGLTVGLDVAAGGLPGFHVEAGFAIYDDTGPPAVGETWGPKADQWELSKDCPGFICLGVVDADRKIMLAMRDSSGDGRGILFTLYESLADGTAYATVDHYWGVAPKDEDGSGHVLVHDEQHLFRGARTGDKGIAIWDSGAADEASEENPGGVYRVIECTSTAGLIAGTLTGPSTAAVTGYTGAQQDTTAPAPVVSAVDTQNFFNRSIAGDKIVALYDALNDRYVVVNATGKAGWIVFEADAAYGTQTISGLYGYGGTELDLTAPLGVTLVDPLGILAGFDFEESETIRVFAIYDKTNDQYVVVNSEEDGNVSIGIELGADINAGAGPFAATIDGTAIAVTVHDSQGLFPRAKSGAKGRAVWDSEEDQWELAECESQAGAIKFTLTGDMDGSATATVGQYWGTQQDIQGPGSTVTVHDRAAAFTDAETGDGGIAIYDAVADEYVVVAMGGKKILLRVTLAEDRTGGAIDAVISGTESDVQVWDSQALFLRAKNGADGLAAWNNADERWELVECESQAGEIAFALTSDMTGSGSLSASATVTSSWGTQQDNQGPGSSLTVHDPDGLFPRAITGAKGIAVYDAAADEYIVVQCQQEALFLKASLSADMHEGDSTGSVTSLTVASPSPFNLSPDISSATNPYALCGSSGAAVLLVCDGTGGYIIAQIAHVKTKVISDIRYADYKLEYRSRDIQTPRIDPESDWTTLVETEECTPQ